jgi:DNA-binding protein HU-beta
MNVDDIVVVLSKEYRDTPKKVLSEITKSVFQAIPEITVNAPLRTPIGTFKVVTLSARQGRNPQTGEVISIPAKQVLKFKEAKKK